MWLAGIEPSVKVNTPILSLEAVDPDVGAGQKIVFSIVEAQFYPIGELYRAWSRR